MWFICTLLTDRNEHVAAKADSSLSNRRASLSRSLATGLSVDSRLAAGATRIFGSQLDPDIVAVRWTWIVKTLPHANHTTSQLGRGRIVSIGSGIHKSRGHVRNWAIMRSRLNWITGPGPKSGSAGKSEPRGPENGVSRWRRPNSDIYSQKSSFWLYL